MIFLRAVDVARPARAGRQRRIDRHILAGRRARQHAQQLRGVGERRHYLLQRGDDDVNPGQDLRQIAVALVGDDDRASRLGDEKIRAGDADVGGKELVAQDGARLAEQLLGLRKVARRRQIAMGAAKVGFDVVAADMDGRRDDVRGRLAAQLDDVFAEIGLDRLDSRRFQRRVEADLLGDHRLALGHRLGAALLAQAEDDRVRLRRVARVVHMAARFARPCARRPGDRDRDGRACGP